MNLENVVVSEDVDRYVASCRKEVDGHLFSFILSNTLKQSDGDILPRRSSGSYAILKSVFDIVNHNPKLLPDSSD